MYCTKEINAYTIWHNTTYNASMTTITFETNLLELKTSPLDKLINQQDGTLAYKVIGAFYLLSDILTDRQAIHSDWQICHTFSLADMPYILTDRHAIHSHWQTCHTFSLTDMPYILTGRHAIHSSNPEIMKTSEFHGTQWHTINYLLVIEPSKLWL